MEKVTDVLTGQMSTGSVDPKSGQLSSSDFMKYVEETRSQPAFRASMDKAGDYYDGNQMTAEQLGQLDQMGFGSLMTNLIKPSIDTVLGLEAKNRTDFRCVSDDDQNQPVAEAMSAKLAEAERESRADRACADAYGSQVKTGLGWARIGRNSDPFLYPYKAESVHRREMYWDWAARDPYLEDARYVIRRKWYPLDQVLAAMPSKADVLQAGASGWSPAWLGRARESAVLMNAFDQENRMSVSDWDWRNIDERRIELQECWYSMYARGLILRLPNGKTVELDKKNQLHMALISQGIVKPESAVYRKLRCSIWFGPHKLQDDDSGKNKLPYVPFWGFREDLTGVPYGLIRSMMPLQDEVNARRRKLMWLLSSKRVQVDADALDARYNEFADLVAEIARPDSVVVLNPARKNVDALKVDSDLNLASQQLEILQEAKEGIQAAAGIFNSIMGKTDGAKSGVAVNALVEQSSNTLGEINDNFKMSRQRVGELLVQLIREDMSGKQVTVMTGANSSKRKTIILNAPKIDDITGQQYFHNDTDKADFKVALEEVPSTPAYRAQQMMTIGETLKAMPPPLQASMMPFYIEATDLPKRQEMAKALRTALGQVDENGEEQDPQVAQLKQQLQLVSQHSEQAAQSYEQAVQEQAKKAQAAETENAQLKGQLANRQGELQLKGQELQLKSQEMQANAGDKQAQAQERMAIAQAKGADVQLKGKELEIKQQELQIAAAKAANDADHAQREHGLKRDSLEHDQLSAASGQPDIKQIVDQAIAPLRDELARTKADLAQRAALDKARMQGVKEGMATAGSEGEQNLDPAKEEKRTQEMHEETMRVMDSTIDLNEAKAKQAMKPPPKPVAGAPGAKPGAAKPAAAAAAPPPSPAPAPAAAKKKTIKFLRGTDGKLSGAEVSE